MKKHLPLVFVPLAIAWIATSFSVAERAAKRSSHFHVPHHVQFIK